MIDIGNYAIIHQLGEGGMATVYLAEHKTLRHKVAIKVLAKEFLYNKGIKDRFIDEAKKMVRMNHPNVVKVTDLINDGDSVAIVMEYVDGETLRDLLSKKKLNDNEIENYLKQMVSALDYVHKQGLVHRDIKPSNFIFNSEGILKLTDFGISKNLSGELNERTQTGTAMSLGTPMYMSPEQVKSTKDVSHLSDIYSLGVVLWEMAAGKKPYDLGTLSGYDLMTKVVNDPLPVTDTKWDEIIQKATEKSESTRLQKVSTLLEFSVSERMFVSNEDKTIVSVFTKNPIPKVEGVDGNKNEKKKLFLIICVISICALISFIIFQNTREKHSSSGEIKENISVKNNSSNSNGSNVDPTQISEGNISFSKYCNDRYDYCVDYPDKILFPQGESISQDGQSFLATNLQSKLSIYRDVRFEENMYTPLPIGEAFENDLWKFTFKNSGYVITYKVLKDKFYIISGMKKGEIMYQKSILKNGELYTCVLYYKETDRAVFDKVAERIFQTFK